MGLNEWYIHKKVDLDRITIILSVPMPKRLSPINLYLNDFGLKGSSTPQRGCFIISKVALSIFPVMGRLVTFWKILISSGESKTLGG